MCIYMCVCIYTPHRIYIYNNHKKIINNTSSSARCGRGHVLLPVINILRVK